jgi:hypothetical protein
MMKRQKRPILVERDGELYRLEKQEPPDIWAGYDPAKAREGLKQAAGALAGIDREELLADIYAQREQDSVGRPAITPRQLTPVGPVL